MHQAFLVQVDEVSSDGNGHQSDGKQMRQVNESVDENRASRRREDKCVRYRIVRIADLVLREEMGLSMESPLSSLLILVRSEESDKRIALVYEIREQPEADDYEGQASNDTYVPGREVASHPWNGNLIESPDAILKPLDVSVN